jgi:hypothetical protein
MNQFGSVFETCLNYSDVRIFRTGKQCEENLRALKRFMNYKPKYPFSAQGKLKVKKVILMLY